MTQPEVQSRVEPSCPCWIVAVYRDSLVSVTMVKIWPVRVAVDQACVRVLVGVLLGRLLVGMRVVVVTIIVAVGVSVRDCLVLM